MGLLRAKYTLREAFLCMREYFPFVRRGGLVSEPDPVKRRAFP